MKSPRPANFDRRSINEEADSGPIMLVFFEVGRPEVERDRRTEMRCGNRILTAAAGIGLLAGLASANIMPPNTTLYRPGSEPLGGVTYSTSLPSYMLTAGSFDASLAIFSLSSTIVPNQTLPAPIVSGTLDSWVFDHGTGLTFVYKLTVDGGSQDIGRVSSDGDWHFFNIWDAGAEGSGNDAPIQLRHGSPGTISMTWNPEVPGTEMSAYVFFETDATLWRRVTAEILDGSASGTAQMLVAAIPLPSAGLMGLAGLGLIAGRRRNR